VTKSPPFKYEFSGLNNCIRDSPWEGMPANIPDKRFVTDLSVVSGNSK
jgi:hypothetical protein